MKRRSSVIDFLKDPDRPIETVLLDIDGVLLHRGQALPGSRQLLAHMDHARMVYRLVTNDGNHATTEKAQRLRRAGLPVDAARIVSCGHAIAPLIEAQNRAGQLFFIMGDTGSPCYAEAAGLRTTRDLRHLDQCHGVIIGEENYDWEPVINAVINYFIDQPQALLIIPNPDEYYPDPIRTIHVAAGGVGRFMVRVLETYGIRVAPIYLGKPYGPIFQLAEEKLKQALGHPNRPQKTLMLGDNLDADIAGGNAAGYITGLLMTGVTTEQALADIPSDRMPDFVFKSL